MLNSLQPEQQKVPVEKIEKRRSVFFWVFIVVSLIIGSLLIRNIVKSRETDITTTLTPRKIGFFDTVKNFIFRPNNILIGQNEDRINILLLGVGGPGHDGPYLSDTNIIVSIKPSTNEIALISVPRDLAAKVGNHGWRKINGADAFGEAEQPGAGGDYARKVFEENFNIKIPYYIRVDFTAFEDIINSVGGITVNVPNSFTDSAYPGKNFSFQTISFVSGVQTMNGDDALKYARSRHGNNGEGSDFARARRQQLILEALKEKMLSLGTYANPNRLQEIYSSLASHVNTNFNFAEMAYLASFANDISGSRRLVLDSAPGGYLINTTGENGAFILSPKTGNFDSINSAIANIFSTPGDNVPIASNIPTTVSEPIHSSPVAATSSANLKIEVENGTWIPGLAARIQKKLQDKGFEVIMVGNSLKRPIERTVIYILNNQVNASSVAGLSSLLKAANTNTLPEWLADSYDNPKTPEDETGMKYNKDADILIILGTDTKE
ncbi:MAG: LCP family protein [Patescibacteria group bacterium]|jgi:LCP family protein required for cell wall assembly